MITSLEMDLLILVSLFLFIINTTENDLIKQSNEFDLKIRKLNQLLTKVNAHGNI